ncbi:Na+/H+ antiporter NhaA [Dokdonella sp. MW10]|uniref:Na+/H+ antiporter NhaA n=1 Tax=Dokdonella sp. MW10 TaxID=2992926 RepID=UPI003F8220D0
MPTLPPHLPRLRILADRAFLAIDRILHVEAVGGVVLLCAAIAALAWANSPWASYYDALWHASLTLGLGDAVLRIPLHAVVNDGLMTVFFLVVGMEIRREMHEGSLADLRSATLPLAAAIGGVLVPAAIFGALNHGGPGQDGWAVPMATDIAFAVGVLALLGRIVPANVRIFLLALAILDDVVAVLVIALFYSGGLQPEGLALLALGIGGVFLLQAIGVGRAWVYVVPGAAVWGGMLWLGVHPTLAGVLLGLLTPVDAFAPRGVVLDTADGALRAVTGVGTHAGSGVGDPVRRLRWAQRELLPPVVRVQAALHPWVAYGVMPIFAFANAGVAFGGVDLAHAGASTVLAGVVIGLVVGKPVGIVAASWIAVRLGWCRLPDGVTWRGVTLVGLLGGIGFTMSIFIAMLAFDDAGLLAAAKLGVLLASAIAACLGLAWALLTMRRRA